MVIRRKAELTTSRWSGGTTTELFIYPAGSSYSARDFDVRISTATVEFETSEFTILPGYSRILVVLEGSLKLHFDTERPYEAGLEAGEQICFPGDYRTTGYGKVRDFNVMTRGDYFASVEVHRVANGSLFVPEHGPGPAIVFVLAGMVAAEGKECTAGDTIVSEGETTLKLAGLEYSILLLTRIGKIEQKL